MSVCTEDILSLSLPPSMDSRIASDTATQHTTTTTTTQQPFATLSRSTSKAPHSGTESGKRRLLHHCNINSSTISITHTHTLTHSLADRAATVDYRPQTTAGHRTLGRRRKKPRPKPEKQATEKSRPACLLVVYCDVVIASLVY